MKKLVIQYDEEKELKDEETLKLKLKEEQRRAIRLAKAEAEGDEAYNKSLDDEASRLTIFDFFENEELANANKDKSFTILEKANIVVHSSFDDAIKNAYLRRLEMSASNDERKLIEYYIDNYAGEDLKDNPFNCIVELNTPYKPFDYILIKDITSDRCVVADPNDSLVKKVKNDYSLSSYDPNPTKRSWVKLNIANYFIENTEYSKTGRKLGEINASYRYQYYSFKLSDIERIDILDMTVREILMIEELKKQAKENAEKGNW